ncbi:caspase-8-like [Homarus americanus]|uniref:Caspase-8-like n=1 Tax=Homarus americanus TaxID=6706 RepID=A0A8J5TH78_HOMAM|nr:caspase-8-like [Homarus americanus]
MDQGFLSKVKDDEVPKMLFLSVNPNKKALDEKSISPVRRELQLRLLKLSSMELNKRNSLSTLESNFSDESDLLNNDEEDILEFTEIFEMFNYSAPETIKSNFGNIVSSKKIPVARAVGSHKKKTFFVYAENKIMMKICDSLTPGEVFLMYEVLRESKAVERDDTIKDLLSQPIDLRSLENVAGLKDVAFYYLILNLMKKQILNRLYTHKLSFIFHQLKQIKEKSDTPHPHIDRILMTLDRYPVASQPPGLCLIFIMEENRAGAQKDLMRVRELFEKVFKYDVFVKINPSSEDIKTIVSKLKAARNKFYDSLVVWFMGHGDKTYLEAKNSRIHRRVDLIEPFTEIEWFFKKPKLFFIQACAVKKDRKRFSSTSGGEKALPTQTDSVGWRAAASTQWQDKYADYTDVSNVNTFADTLISYATMWYQYASRGEEGSLYVDTLVDQLLEYGSKESIENVLRRVHYNVNTVGLQYQNQDFNIYWKQAPYFESSLQKAFIFPNTEKTT